MHTVYKRTWALPKWLILCNWKELGASKVFHFTLLKPDEGAILGVLSALKVSGARVLWCRREIQPGLWMSWAAYIKALEERRWNANMSEVVLRYSFLFLKPFHTNWTSLCDIPYPLSQVFTEMQTDEWLCAVQGLVDESFSSKVEDNAWRGVHYQEIMDHVVAIVTKQNHI